MHADLTQVQTAVETALLSLESHKWVSLQSSAARRQKLLSPQGSDKLSRTLSSPSKGDGPPYELMDHSPLAVLVNGLLSALNELRHCAPLSLIQQLAAVLQVSDSDRSSIEKCMRVHSHCKSM